MANIVLIDGWERGKRKKINNENTEVFQQECFDMSGL